MMGASKSDPILIVGAGAFGLSTALHLARNGYSNLTVLDKGTGCPSGFSAANDVNKILRVEYDDDFYTELAVVRCFPRQPQLRHAGLDLMNLARVIPFAHIQILRLYNSH